MKLFLSPCSDLEIDVTVINEQLVNQFASGAYKPHISRNLYIDFTHIRAGKSKAKNSLRDIWRETPHKLLTKRGNCCFEKEKEMTNN